MSFKAHVKKFQSIEDGTMSVLLRVPAEDASKVMALYQQDVIVQDVQTVLPEDRNDLLKDIRVQLESISQRLSS